jgi:hypothetical protein
VNAHVRVSPARAIRGLIADLVCRYDNYDTGRERAALAAAEASRPAWWTTAPYHHAVACRLAAAANGGSLEAALAAAVDPRHALTTRAALLATLVPLNTPAAIALAAAKGR